MTCVLWLLGFEVFPWLHIATHDHVRKHHHDASGAIVFDDESDHDHEGADDDRDADVDEHAADAHDDDDDRDAEVDEHGRPVAHAHHAHHAHEPQDQRDTVLRDALGHGRHSFAHHDIATTAPPPVLTRPLPIDRRPTFVFAETALEPYSFSPGRAVARGPPPTTVES